MTGFDERELRLRSALITLEDKYFEDMRCEYLSLMDKYFRNEDLGYILELNDMKVSIYSYRQDGTMEILCILDVGPRGDIYK